MVQGSLNRHHKGSNELPYDRVLQGAAHQAPQGFVICLVSFELPNAACALPHHRATHGVAHGAIHMHHVIHGAIHMSIQGAIHTLIALVRSLMNHPMVQLFIWRFIMFQPSHKVVHHAVQSLCA